MCPSALWMVRGSDPHKIGIYLCCSSVESDYNLREATQQDIAHTRSDPNI